jgi:hypothetical protein
MSKKFSYEWRFNSFELNNFINKFKIKNNKDYVELYFGDNNIDTIYTKFNISLQNNKLIQFIFNKLIENKFNISSVYFEYKDNFYEFKIYGDVYKSNYQKYICISDSIDNKLALQLNFGFINKENILFINNSEIKSVYKWKYGKYTFEQQCNTVNDAISDINKIYDDVYNYIFI